MNKFILLFLFNPLLSISQEKDSSFINKIVRKINILAKSGNKSYTKTTNSKKLKEIWQYFDNKQYARIIIDYTIDSIDYSVAYTEKYYFSKGSLIYAYESEILFGKGEKIEEGTTWAGDFYFSKNKLIDYVTLGHGNSELDDWDPEKEILQKLKGRRAELKQVTGNR